MRLISTEFRIDKAASVSTSGTDCGQADRPGAVDLGRRCFATVDVLSSSACVCIHASGRIGASLPSGH